MKESTLEDYAMQDKFLLPYCVCALSLCRTDENSMCLIRFAHCVYQDNSTPLYVAREKGHHDVVQILLGAGADVNNSSR